MIEDEILRSLSIAYTVDSDYTCEHREDCSDWHIWTSKRPLDIHVSGLTVTEAGKQWIATHVASNCTVTATLIPCKRRRKRTWSFARIYRQWAASVRAKKRERRQHRAVFRRRKRGLA